MDIQTVQTVLNSVYENASIALSAGTNMALEASVWLGRTVVVLSTTIAEYAKTAYEAAKPHFAHLKELAIENKSSIGLAAASFATGVVAFALVNSIFGTKQPAQPPQVAAV